MKYNVITISREFGSGGRYVGEELAKNSAGNITIRKSFPRWLKRPALLKNLLSRRVNIHRSRAYSPMALSAETAAALLLRIMFIPPREK